MNTHLKVVAILHIVLGAMGLLGTLIIFTVFGTAGGVVLWQGEQGVAALIGFVALCIGGLIALLSLPDIIGGWALLAQKSWARVFMMILGFLDLFHFPFGTMLGIYTLWVLFRAEAQVPLRPTAS